MGVNHGPRAEEVSRAGKSLIRGLLTSEMEESKIMGALSRPGLQSVCFNNSILVLLKYRLDVCIYYHLYSVSTYYIVGSDCPRM